MRSTPGRLVTTGADEVEATELWIIRTDGTGLRRLLQGRNSERVEDILADFTAPQFSPDAKRIYFLSGAWATSSAVHVFDLRTGRQKFLCDANTLEVIQKGRRAGYLRKV
jgi:hypothetical protein